MGKKIALGVVALLAVIAAFVMRDQGNTNPNLTEMKGVWWIPLPLGIICAVLALKPAPKS